jgi:hypothetical protein
MGEKPEKTVTYILEVLGKLGQQRVALMDAMRAAKDAGGSSLKSMQNYYGIRNIVHNTVTTTTAKSDITTTVGDDDRNLGKIVELAFVRFQRRWLVKCQAIPTTTASVILPDVTCVGRTTRHIEAGFHSARRRHSSDGQGRPYGDVR